ncbi:MAG TPA: hypothetical protein PK156_47385 [Polyangium sp.]|nr:hypothetical protein [Polyangium sp.]
MKRRPRDWRPVASVDRAIPKIKHDTSLPHPGDHQLRDEASHTGLLRAHHVTINVWDCKNAGENALKANCNTM